MLLHLFMTDSDAPHPAV